MLLRRVRRSRCWVMMTVDWLYPRLLLFRRRRGAVQCGRLAECRRRSAFRAVEFLRKMPVVVFVLVVRRNLWVASGADVLLFHGLCVFVSPCEAQWTMVKIR